MPDFVGTIFAPNAWPTFVLVTARMTGLMLVAPLWSMAMLPRMARAGIVVVLSVLMLPMTPRATLPPEVMQIPVPILLEVLIGVAIGLTAAVIVHGMSLAGEVVSLQMGLSLGPALSPMAELETSGISQLQGILALLIYVTVGGHLVLLQGLAESLRTIPPGGAIDLAQGANRALAGAAALFTTAVRAAAPVMVALLLANVAIAILNRAVPHLNTMMVALPITFGIGLIMLGIALPVIGSAVAGWMQDLPGSVMSGIDSFAPAAAGP